MTIFEEISETITKQFKVNSKYGEIKPDTDLIKDLGFDSLDSVELIIELEDKFKIELLDKEAENIKTVQDIMDLVESKKK
jgi:acyl carrier protein